jgi:cysteine desulfurase
MNALGVTSPHPGLADGPICLDYNATTPVDPCVAETAQPYLTTHFGNPSRATPTPSGPAARWQRRLTER